MTDEYFKRKDVLKILMDVNVNPLIDDKIGESIECICNLPPEDVAEVVHAYWHDIYQFGEDYWHIPDNVGTCSHCGNSSHFNVPLGTKYCPDCGARMDFHEREDVKE